MNSQGILSDDPMEQRRARARYAMNIGFGSDAPAVKTAFDNLIGSAAFLEYMIVVELAHGEERAEWERRSRVRPSPSDIIARIRARSAAQSPVTPTGLVMTGGLPDDETSGPQPSDEEIEAMIEPQDPDDAVRDC